MSARRLALFACAALVVSACALLSAGGGGKAKNPKIFVLEPGASASASSGLVCGRIQITPGRAASGHRSAHMAYMRTPYQLEYFAYAMWADSPARLLGEQIRHYFALSDSFSAVVSTPAAAATDFRLELADGRVLQRFVDETSTLEVSLEARLYATGRPELLRSQRFSVVEAAEPNPEGGVAAANRAAARLLPDVWEFVTRECER